MSQSENRTVKIEINGPVAEGLMRVVVSGNGADEVLMLDQHEVEEFDEPELKIELILENCTSPTYSAIETAGAVTLDDETVDIDKLQQVIQALRQVRNSR